MIVGTNKCVMDTMQAIRHINDFAQTLLLFIIAVKVININSPSKAEISTIWTFLRQIRDNTNK